MNSPSSNGLNIVVKKQTGIGAGLVLTLLVLASVAISCTPSQTTLDTREFPGLQVILQRGVWKGDELQVYWLIYNNSREKIDSWLSNMVFTATDQMGYEGESLSGGKEFEDIKAEFVADLWPGEKTEYLTKWKFGPLSKSITVSITYYPEGKYPYRSLWETHTPSAKPAYRAMWNIQR